MTIISKKQMSEEDIKLQYITPAITAKWDIKKITMETNITDGKINLKGNFITREKPKRADYVLYLNPNNPIAIVEAKDNKHSISHGLQQAMAYASMLDIPFAYSSNGDGFFEHDFLTGKERELDLDEFPTEEELYCRYKNGANNGEGLSENQEKMIQQPYYSSQKTYPPRYYQRIAINRTVDAISMGKDRLLLVMATGTGKTYTAFQIVYRLLKSGMKKSTDRMAKTIVFCATEDAAERMRVALVNQNSDMVQKNPDYVVRITGSDTYGKSKLDYFISVREKYPVIATTSKLLSTGSDCKMTKLIVLDEMIGSMTEFKQIIGRGTRLREKEGKTHFVVMDFRNVSRLFADPDWDGPIEMDEDFNPKSGSGKNTKPPVGPGPDPVDPKQPKPIVNRDGCQVKIVYKTVSVYDANGKLLRQESIIDYTKENILGAYASLDNFIRKWSAEEKKEKIRGLLREQGIDLETLKEDQGMSDVDDFDFICHVAFDKKPLTRKERAENVKKRDFLNKYSGAAREVLEALLDKYMNTGIYEIEKTEILKLDPFMKMGKPQKIASYFGGKDGYLKAVKELENAIYDGGAA